jgi:hypothetical protein
MIRNSRLQPYGLIFELGTSISLWIQKLGRMETKTKGQIKVAFWGAVALSAALGLVRNLCMKVLHPGKRQ